MYWLPFSSAPNANNTFTYTLNSDGTYTVTATVTASSNPDQGVLFFGTVFVLSLPSQVSQTATIAPAVASSSNTIDPGLQQATTFLSRTQLTNTLSTSQSQDSSDSTVSVNLQPAATETGTNSPRGAGSRDKNDDEEFWQRFDREYQDLLEAAKAPPQPAAGQPRPPMMEEQEQQEPQQQQEQQPEQPEKMARSEPPSPDQLKPEDWKEIARPIRPSAAEPGDSTTATVTGTDLFGQALLSGAMTFPLFALSQEAARKRHIITGSIGLSC